MRTGSIPLSSSEAHGDLSHDLKPSMFESPLLRFRFTDDLGRDNHATFSTTWDRPELLTELMSNPDSSEAQAYRQNLAGFTDALFGTFGCTIVGIDFITNEFEEL